MFRSKTVFVVGAGASCEVGLPAGSEIKFHIANRLDIRFPDGWQQKSGSFTITEALREHLRQSGIERGDINPFLAAAWSIRDAAPQAISIDNYIEAHQDDPRIELCGKLAIVESILDAERVSKLYVKYPDSLAHESLTGTWYPSFLQLLTENVRKANIETLFANISFVIFNYDRCLEHFLAHALRSYYVIPEEKAQELVTGLTVFHPYGSVGRLPWQDRQGITFGANLGTSKLLEISSQLKTFTERIEEEKTITAIRKEIQEADTLIFLGFAFHDLNMKLLKSEEPSSVRRVFCTSKGISHGDWPVVERNIVDTLQSGRETTIVTQPNLTCADLFKDYWHRISKG